MLLSVPILMYHKVGAAVRVPADKLYNVSASAFAAQMRFLARCGFHGITVTDAVDGLQGRLTLPPRPVAVTFDDAFACTGENAVPVLNTLGWPASVYVPTAHVGGTNAWDAPQSLPQLPLMDWNALRSLSAAGWEIGAHTRTHTNLAACPEAEARQEIGESIRECAAHIGQPVRTFAYPYGASGPLAGHCLQQAGLTGACSTRYGVAGPQDNPFLLPRIHIGYRYGVWGLAYALWIGPRLGKSLS